jgi:hypothetical protein
VDVEWIILADAAEAVNNKLYLIGGGWETLTINPPLPLLHPCAIAIAFSVPWNETNQRHNIEIVVDDQDGAQLVKVAGQVEVGRPPGIPLGRAQRVQMALGMALPIQKTGTYVIIVRVEGQEAKRVDFYIVAGPNLASQSS